MTRAVGRLTGAEATRDQPSGDWLRMVARNAKRELFGVDAEKPGEVVF